MFKIENKNIYCNRGDAMKIIVANNTDTFHAGDIIRFRLCEKDDYTKVILTKEIPVTEDTIEVLIDFTSEDTQIGEPQKDKSVEYWYEIELNGDTTLVGYDSDGPKLFTLWPEAIEGGSK